MFQASPIAAGLFVFLQYMVRARIVVIVKGEGRLGTHPPTSLGILVRPPLSETPLPTSPGKWGGEEVFNPRPPVSFLAKRRRGGFKGG